MGQQVRTEDLYQGDGQEKSAGQLVKEVSEDVSTLIRKEVELAKQEIGDQIGARAKGAAILAAVGFMAFLMLIFLLLAVRDGFTELWAAWIADLATVGVLVVIGSVAVFIAKRMLATPISAELTKKNIKEDVELVKSLGKR
jgi:uncharacterized membrane protein YqjE